MMKATEAQCPKCGERSYNLIDPDSQLGQLIASHLRLRDLVQLLLAIHHGPPLKPYEEALAEADRILGSVAQ